MVDVEHNRLLGDTKLHLVGSKLESKELSLKKSILHPRFYDIFKNGKPVIRENKPSPIRIFQNTQGIFYLQKLHDDRSHYPQQLRTDKNKKNRFKIFDEQEGYFEIEENGTLKIVSEDGSFVRFTSVKK